jgi:hypothetical protein
MADVNRTSVQRGYEVTDAPPVRLFVAGLLVLAGIGLVLLLVWGMVALFRGMEHGPPAPPLARVPVETPPPRLQWSPARDLQELRAAEDRELHTLGWVDLDAGLARIPIENAMALLVERGWPQEGQP